MSCINKVGGSTKLQSQYIKNVTYFRVGYYLDLFDARGMQIFRLINFATQFGINGVITTSRHHLHKNHFATLARVLTDSFFCRNLSINATSR